MNTKHLAFITTIALLGLVVSSLCLLTRSIHAAQPNSLTVCPAGPPDCDHAQIQNAVDAAGEGDTIKIAAGLYTDLHVRPRRDITTTGVVTQVVYVSKTVTLRGGYTAPDFAEPPDPEANPTTLDAQGQGRVLYITGAISPTVEGLRITGGDADGLGGWWGVGAGGGVYAITAALTISASQISTNTASVGAGLYLYRCNNPTLDNNVITANSIPHFSGIPPYPAGGGLWIGWCTDTVLKGNTIFSNTAHTSGGGVYLLRLDSASLDGNTISANSAASCGGLYIGGNNVVLKGNSIRANRALNFSGGGLCLADEALLVNNLIVDNRAGTSGSGLAISDASPRLVHTTLARNKGGDGSGIYVTRWFAASHLVTMTNTILVSHAVGISVTAGNTVTLEATLWGTGTWANDANWGGSGTVVTGTRNFWGDPAFIAPDTGDYHLGPNSAALDRGVDAGVPDDIDGDLRPDHCFFDIGADERLSGVDCNRLYLPLIFKKR